MNQPQQPIFWLVWNPDGRAPTYKHHSVENAKAEAKRLAISNPGQEFFVMASIVGYTLPQPQPVEIEIDEIPF